MVSMIVPVYNVENYIDKCLDSVVNQTYKDIEILIMEAKSTDRSLFKCIEWAKKDDRITIVSRKDGGLGPGRNYGLNISKGEYIVYVDSDDWIPYDFVEKMVETMESHENLDLVIADTDSCNAHGEIMSGHRSRRGIEVFYDIENKKRIMIYERNSAWGKLYRKSILTENGIIQPALVLEDLAVFPSVVAVSRGIAICHDTNYCYLELREDSLMRNPYGYKSIPDVYDYSKCMLADKDRDGVYESAFALLMYKRFYGFRNICLGHDWYRKRATEYPEMEIFDKKNFEIFFKSRRYAFGGFALRWTAHKLVNDVEGVPEHFTFTSIIAQMTKSGETVHVNHENGFRETSINRDINGCFQDIKQIPNEVDSFLIDLIQECTDILILSDGNCVSDTEELKETDFDYSKVSERLDYRSVQFWELWKTKCQEFADRLEKLMGNRKIFLIRNFYVPVYYADGKLKKYETDIAEKNNILQKMYDYFEKICPQAIVIEPEKDFQFTEMLFRPYSPEPFYYNEYYYEDAAMKIESVLFDV
jgi:glycosyltransferase involved in cell wall biosynthesis